MATTPRSEASQLSIGQYIIRRLQDYGLADLFGIPGDYVLTFYGMLEKSPINVVGCTREDCAGFAADAYARIHGLGAVCVTYCVGGLSVCNSIAGAYAEKSPVVLLTGSPGLNERDNNDVDEDSSPLVESSLLYEGGCVFSSQAMGCKGGDSSTQSFDPDFDFDEDFSDDEDEDDDEDDGHSSMLSNASIRRTRALATGSDGPSTPTSSESSRTTETAYYTGEVILENRSKTSSALFLRGGHSDGYGSSDEEQSPYIYSETFSYEPESHVDYHEELSFEPEDLSDSSSIVSSSLIYEGGCFVSSEAMMINGGDSIMQADESDFDEDFSDDEDDDEDDGHSSMLSNASLRRSRALASGSVASNTRAHQQHNSYSQRATYLEREVSLKRKSEPSSRWTSAFLRPWGVSLQR